MKNIKRMGTVAVTLAGTLAMALSASRGLQAVTAPTARIAVAAVDIDLGQRLAPRFIKLIDCPQGHVPPGAFDDPHKLDGRVLTASLLRGEPLVENRLQPVASTAGTTGVIDAVLLPLSVQMSGMDCVQGLALPGNRVDILVEQRQSGGATANGAAHTGAATAVLLRQVLVLSMTRHSEQFVVSPRVTQVVTLAVTPADAARIELARRTGTLSLQLHNLADRYGDDPEQVAWLALLGEPVSRPGVH
ncbi:MAG: Flp pilus assembly protein CpaB [Paraburkholderia sp.]|uniref:Flp pilus assembly protein CpaB n=1 Tax=Paraburkholderia sp. TaxID=1926495 RepID=UPI00397DD709